jgi:hypothetical protein
MPSSSSDEIIKKDKTLKKKKNLVIKKAKTAFLMHRKAVFVFT